MLTTLDHVRAELNLAEVRNGRAAPAARQVQRDLAD